jgi:hypothetical protein
VKISVLLSSQLQLHLRPPSQPSASGQGVNSYPLWLSSHRRGGRPATGADEKGRRFTRRVRGIGNPCQSSGRRARLASPRNISCSSLKMLLPGMTLGTVSAGQVSCEGRPAARSKVRDRQAQAQRMRRIRNPPVGGHQLGSAGETAMDPLFACSWIVTQNPRRGQRFIPEFPLWLQGPHAIDPFGNSSACRLPSWKIIKTQH